ncbi:MAG: hypothetical protein PUC40_04635 [Lachnospiraceae bacterium]|jgi:hypothetical protein|nr:hypothetical protein [Lachnospiraceae bacterium]MDD5956249.1 hypothetical protein [Lachnospiraceae bacterium]MDY3991652.1 hypothetical protein [Lachnospiraceae bacterium]
MQKLKQILGIAAIALLVFMYVLTLVFAIIDNPHTMTLFKASVAATVVIPVVLWVIRIFVKIAKPDNSEFDEATKKKD